MIVPVLGYFINRWKSESKYERTANEGLLVLVGLMSGLISIHFVMDVFYLRGAFLMLPMFYAWVFLWLLLLRGGMPRLRTAASEGISPAAISFFKCRDKMVGATQTCLDLTSKGSGESPLKYAIAASTFSTVTFVNDNIEWMSLINFASSGLS